MAGGKLAPHNPLERLLAAFKTKRELQLALDYAEVAEALLLDAMLELKARFERFHPASKPARLYLRRTGRETALRWRLPKAERNGHDAFELRDDRSPGREMLEALPRTRRREFLKFQSEALTLNVGYALYRYQRVKLTAHMRKLEELERTIARCSADNRKGT